MNNGVFNKKNMMRRSRATCVGVCGDEDNEQEEEECLGWDTYRNKEAGSIKHLGGRSWFSPEWASTAVCPV